MSVLIFKERRMEGRGKRTGAPVNAASLAWRSETNQAAQPAFGTHQSAGICEIGCGREAVSRHLFANYKPATVSTRAARLPRETGSALADTEPGIRSIPFVSLCASVPLTSVSGPPGRDERVSGQRDGRSAPFSCQVVKRVGHYAAGVCRLGGAVPSLHLGGSAAEPLAPLVQLMLRSARTRPAGPPTITSGQSI